VLRILEPFVLKQSLKFEEKVMEDLESRETAEEVLPEDVSVGDEGRELPAGVSFSSYRCRRDC